MKLTRLHLLGALFLGAALGAVTIDQVWAGHRGTSDYESLRSIRPGTIGASANTTADTIPYTLALAGVASSAAVALDRNVTYCFTSDVDAWIDMGTSAVVAAANEGPIWANERVCYDTDDTVKYFAAIRMGAVSGTVWAVRER